MKQRTAPVTRIIKAAGPGAVIVLFVVLGFIVYSVQQVRYFQDKINTQSEDLENLVKSREADAGDRARIAADQRNDLNIKVDKLTAHLDCVLSIRPESRSPDVIRTCLGPDSDPVLEEKIRQFYEIPTPPVLPPNVTVVVPERHLPPEVITVPSPVPVPVPTPIPVEPDCVADIGNTGVLCNKNKHRLQGE